MGSRKLTATMIAQDTWLSVRILHLRQGKRKSWIARELGIARNTVAKYLKDSDAPKYSSTRPRGRPIADKWEEHDRQILEDDRDAPSNSTDTLGFASINDLLGNLNRICSDPKCEISDRAKCLIDAQNIANTLLGFYSNYSDPANGGAATGDDPVNGYWCWDWAGGFMVPCRQPNRHRSRKTIAGS